MSDSVPVIDLDRWRHGGPAESTAVLDEVRGALERSGFLVVVNHGIDPALAASLRRHARTFFALDPATKRAYLGAPGVPGWIPMGGEANAYASGEESPPDLKEALGVGPTHDGAMTISSRGLEPCVNRFPDEVPELRPVIVEWMDRTLALAVELLELIAESLGAPRRTFSAHCDDAIHSILVTRYPSPAEIGPPQPGQYRIGPHCDFGTITVLDREPSVCGLQVELPDGTWVEAPYVADSLTINLGDMMRYWTGGRYRSNKHRLLAPPAGVDEELLSLVFFMEADAHAVIEPLAPPMGATVDWPPVTVLEHLEHQLAAITVEG